MENTLQKVIGQRIRKLRLEKTGLSQEKFAYKIGVDRTYYASIEQGRHAPSIIKLDQIAKGMDISLEEMFRGL